MYGMDSPEGTDKPSFLGEPSLSPKYPSKEGVGQLDSNSNNSIITTNKIGGPTTVRISLGK